MVRLHALELSPDEAGAAEVVERAVALLALTVGHRHQGWLPHVTLARRLRRDDVDAARAALGPGPRELVLASLRHWDPEHASIRTVHAG